MPTGNQKSLCWAYFCLLIGGFFGLHQIYLGRFRHAFALWISFGGYFGLGLIRELWLMPDYVAETNADPKYLERLVNRMRRELRPSFGWVRYLASVIVADILGYLVQGAIPHEWFGEDAQNPVSRALAAILVPFACAFGVHLVGNIGRYEGSIKWPLLAAYLTAPLYWYSMNSVFWTSLLSCLAFVYFSLKWRRTPVHQEQPANYLILIFCIILYLSLWSSWFYFNCTVVKQDETIKCRTAARNFFNSPAWLEFWSVTKNLARYIWNRGLSGLWEEIVEALDPQGEQNALKILNLNASATQEEITAAYRKLARQWHPDKRSDSDKIEAQERFMAIQEAYDLLSQMKQQRRRKVTG